MWLTHGIVSIPTLLLDGAFKNFIPLGMVTKKDNTPSINLLRKHGGKTGEELEAEKTTTF